ncbi:MAG: DUF3455 domain-containing protein [Gammaproteobacteria bacterium]|nr:DUF3455 domain-containing protein [Gammaproteobacteria bacterium]
MFNKIIGLLAFLIFVKIDVRAADAAAEMLKAPDATNLQLTLHAKGDQIFTCVQEGQAYNWKWQAPDAQLFNGQNSTPVGSHGVGPSWKHQDGSSVKAKIAQKIDAPDKTAAPWLLLEATENQGKGIFTQTGFIMRINTQGGLAPAAEECNENRIGAEKRVPYSADYNFYRK